MSEEEKDLLDRLKYIYENDRKVNRYGSLNYSIPIGPTFCKKIIELIEKQQKEIKKLKDDLREERAFSKAGLETLKECVHKDKIKEKIKKCNSILYSMEEEEAQLKSRADIGSVNCLLAQISILNSLLGE